MFFSKRDPETKKLQDALGRVADIAISQSKSCRISCQKKALSCRSSSHKPKALLWQPKRKIFQVSGGQPKTDWIHLF